MCDGYFQNSLLPISYLGYIWDLYVLSLKTKVFCRENNQIHFPMDNGPHIAKIVLIVQPKMPLKMSAQFVYPRPKVWDTIKESLHWASVVFGFNIHDNPVKCAKVCNKSVVILSANRIITQCPTMKLNKRSLPKPTTTTRWKLIPHRSKISMNWNPLHWDPIIPYNFQN